MVYQFVENATASRLFHVVPTRNFGQVWAIRLLVHLRCHDFERMARAAQRHILRAAKALHGDLDVGVSSVLSSFILYFTAR
jgi:hypothetical protein